MNEVSGFELGIEITTAIDRRDNETVQRLVGDATVRMAQLQAEIALLRDARFAGRNFLTTGNGSVIGAPTDAYDTL